jgi:NADP-dependent 3-hydroxy acid dehydrogenase YdfG
VSELKDKVAVVTGAGTGIGRATALALASRGAVVWLVGRRQKVLEEVAVEARSRGATALVCAADVSVADDIRQLAARVSAESGRVDLLVHSAGIIVLGPIATAPIEHLDRQYETNVRGPVQLTQALLPLMMESGHGQIVFVNSMAGLQTGRNNGFYAATKFALKAVAEGLRAELNPKGFRVITVYPGRTATPLGRAVREMEGMPYEPEKLAQPDDVAAMIVAALSLSPAAEVTDVVVRPSRPS